MRIYIGLPLDSGPKVVAVWLTQGGLHPGQLISGQRVLVYSGPINTPLLEDQLIFRLRTDGRWADDVRWLDFRFELETQ